MIDVYKCCPVLENDSYLLRFVGYNDALDLLKVYSDKMAVPFFNSDNCHGDDFYYNTLERMKEAIGYWILEYERKRYVRWSIVDKKKKIVIGTIELFHRNSNDYFQACALLRMDLRSDYEYEKCIESLLALIEPNAYDLFDCRMIATKASSFAEERIKVLKKMNFELSTHKLIGQNGKEYSDYWILLKNTGGVQKEN